MSRNKQLINTLYNQYKQQFSEEPEVLARAPGRANIIGEHTDYNGGFVLPVGIDKNMYAFASKRDDQSVYLYAQDFQDAAVFSLEHLAADASKRWANYEKGVFNEMHRAGYDFSGINMVFGGDIPAAAGLGSSAAVELVTAVLLNNLFDLNMDNRALIHICRSAEKNFVGVQCGIMDQFASCMAKKDSAILLDCKTLDYSYIPFKRETYHIILCNTLKKRALVDSEYNKRKQECQQGAYFFKELNPELEFLSDVDVDLFHEKKDELPATIRRRCEHVIYENRRVLDCVNALKQSNLEKVGGLLLASHNSLKSLYEVSCRELDTLVEIAQGVRGCTGSRMMGAGFGGCTINIVENSHIDEFCRTTESEYYRKTGLRPELYVCELEDGAQII